MSSSCNVGRDKLITATMPMCYTLAFFPNSVNPQFQLDFSTTYHDLLPKPHHNPSYPFKTNVHRCAQRRPAHVVLRSFTTTTCSYTIISIRPCVAFLCFPIRFRDPPGPTRTHWPMNFSSYPTCCACPLREAHQGNPPCQAPSHCSPRGALLSTYVAKNQM